MCMDDLVASQALEARKRLKALEARREVISSKVLELRASLERELEISSPKGIAAEKRLQIINAFNKG